jgi:hypothetical protein
MKHLFQKGNQINKGRKSPRKGKTMIEEYGIEKAKEIKEKIKKPQIGKQYVRMKTKQMFGRLQKGFVYHHPKEYEYDNFFILEEGIHRWIEKHPKSFKLGGLVC